MDSAVSGSFRIPPSGSSRRAVAARALVVWEVSHGGASFWFARRPIEPTPTLDGEDADRLLQELENVCSPEEAKRRTEWARKLLTQVIVPKPDDRAAAE